MTTTEDRAELEIYELGYLVLPSVPEENLSQVVSNIQNILTKEGALEIASEAPFKHPLAYAMSKVVGARKYVANDAYLGWIKFEVAPSQIEVIRAGVEKIEEILRSLIIKAPRETTFTFAAARKAAEQVAEESKREAAAPEPVVE